ncbi:MAG: hypothetical protein NZ898_02720 [Myxococcota bacterium]|nr:hypothetical protein [Myxococcota bacterium]MDW8361286.1 hypothetical protein [Myxococcales bacterium]
MHVHASLLALVLAAACGGSQQQSGLQTTPIEHVSEPPVETSVEADPNPAPASGPARLTVSIGLGESTLEGEVEVVDGAGAVAASGRAGQSFEVPAGNYVVRARVSEAPGVVGSLRGETEVSLAPADERSVRVEMQPARVRLVVKRRGRPVRGARVSLIRHGESDPVATFTPGDEHIVIQPGRYEADVVVGRQTIRATGLTFMEGATQEVPIEIQ